MSDTAPATASLACSTARLTARRAFAVTARPFVVLAAAAAPAAAAATAAPVATRRTVLRFAAALRAPLPDPPPELFFDGAGRLCDERFALFFEPPVRAPPFFAAALRAGAAPRLVEAEAFDDFFADFFEDADEVREDDEAFEADFFDDFAADFFEDFDDPEDLAALFAEDFFALFFAAILFLLFKSFGWGAVRFDERTSAASYNPVYELHEKQCRRT